MALHHPGEFGILVFCRIEDALTLLRPVVAHHLGLDLFTF